MSPKRRHKRVPFASFVVLTVGGDENVSSANALTADISLSGIGVYVDVPLELDSDVSLALNFVGAGSLMTEHVEGRIVYVNKIGATYFTGIEFRQELSPAGQPFLYQRLQMVLGFYEDREALAR